MWEFENIIYFLHISGTFFFIVECWTVSAVVSMITYIFRRKLMSTGKTYCLMMDQRLSIGLRSGVIRSLFHLCMPKELRNAWLILAECGERCPAWILASYEVTAVYHRAKYTKPASGDWRLRLHSQPLQILYQ